MVGEGGRILWTSYMNASEDGGRGGARPGAHSRPQQGGALGEGGEAECQLTWPFKVFGPQKYAVHKYSTPIFHSSSETDGG